MITTPPMKVAVMGAGAVGCYFGGMLARAGHDVTLIARDQHVRAIAQGGLRMETQAFDERVHVRASTDPAAVADAQLVLFCVKSADTEAAGGQIGPSLRRDAVVLCLQNGVDNAQRLRAVIAGANVAGAVVYVGTEMAGPGHMKHHGAGRLVIGRVPGCDEAVQAFVGAGVPCDISDNVDGALWIKLIINCAYNAVSAIAQMPYGQAVQGPGVWDVMRDVVAECLAVARAEGVTVPGDVWGQVAKIVEMIPGQYSSTAQDIARGKPTEIDYLNGHVVRRGEALGVATPANRVLWSLVKLLERRREGA